MNKMKMVVALGACVIAGFVMAAPGGKGGPGGGQGGGRGAPGGGQPQRQMHSAQ